MRIHASWRYGGPAFWGLAILGTTALGETQRFSATVQSEVREYVGSETVESDLAFDSFPDVTTSNLPIIADAFLSRMYVDGDLVASGKAVTVFRDPRLSTDPSPAEFGITAAAFSRDTQHRHSAQGQTTETREVVFTAADILAADGTPIRARSRFFLDGAIIVWSESEVTDLVGVGARMDLTVVQSRPGLSDQTVLEAALRLSGNADGSATLGATGAIGADNVVLLDLSDAASEFGALHVVFIPQISIPYEYDAAVAESFQLKATLAGEAFSQPWGRGALVALGPTGSELAALINDSTDSDAGTILVSLLEARRATARPRVPLAAAKDLELTLAEGDNVAPAGLYLPSCGLFGVESLAAVLILLSAAFISSRRGV